MSPLRTLYQEMPSRISARHKRVGVVNVQSFVVPAPIGEGVAGEGALDVVEGGREVGLGVVDGGLEVVVGLGDVVGGLDVVDGGL